MAEMNLLECLILVSEKAANIARLCRQDEYLFQLLVQEKSNDESNPRFVRDFKTLADVLIQETVKHDVGMLFPEIKDNIFGEENNIFENTLGDCVTVEVLDSEDDTANLLKRVLNGDEQASKVLARNVHKTIKLSDINTEQDFPEVSCSENLAIWIDPIDSTAEYINGMDKQTPDGVYVTGLRCVTVLIGVFDRSTGKPILGIVNQPFYDYDGSKWDGRCFWASENKISVLLSENTTNNVCLSSSEDPNVKDKLKSAGFNLIESAGAGYKILLVILGIVDVYLLTKSSTFKWDTCGPQSLLEKQNGGLIVYDDAICGELVPVNYKMEETSNSKVKTFCNNGGIIAYNNLNVLNRILQVLK